MNLTQRIERDLPMTVPEAFAWLTDYSDTDSSILGRGTARHARRIDEWRWELTDTLQRDQWDTAMQGNVVLTPPDRWRYGGRLLAGGEEMAAFEARYRLEPRDGGSRIVVEFEATPIGERGRKFIEAYGERMKAHFERVYDRLLVAMQSK
jgi:hypothetical protein